jgi:hypothetical protein
MDGLNLLGMKERTVIIDDDAFCRKILAIRILLFIKG